MDVKEPRVPWARPGALYNSNCFIQSSSSLRELSVADVLSINRCGSCVTSMGGGRRQQPPYTAVQGDSRRAATTCRISMENAQEWAWHLSISLSYPPQTLSGIWLHMSHRTHRCGGCAIVRDTVRNALNRHELLRSAPQM